MKKVIFSSFLAASLLVSGAGASLANSPTINSFDLEEALMLVQSQRASILETQLRDQIENVQQRNHEIAILNEQLANLNEKISVLPVGDKKQRQQLEQQKAELKNKIDTLSDSSQMDMLRLQSLSTKRNEAFDLMTNFIKKMQNSRNSILENMR